MKLGVVEEEDDNGTVSICSSRYGEGPWYYGLAAGSPGNDTGEISLTPKMRDELVALLLSIQFTEGK